FSSLLIIDLSPWVRRCSTRWPLSSSTVKSCFGRPHICPLVQPSGKPLAPSLSFVQSSTTTTSAAHAGAVRRRAVAKPRARADPVEVPQVMTGPMIPFGRDGFGGFAPRGQVALGFTLFQDSKPGRRRVRRGQSGRQRRHVEAGQAGTSGRPPPHHAARRQTAREGAGARRDAWARAGGPRPVRRPDAPRAAAGPPGAAAVAGAWRRPADQARAPGTSASAGVLSAAFRGSPRTSHRDFLLAESVDHPIARVGVLI